MSSMVNQFSQVPTVSIPRNAFVRNHTWKGTINSGYLYPVFFDEVLPGDTKRLDTTFFGRLSTPFVPVMDNIYLTYHLFFVPNRLTWDHWQNFMGERKNPKDSIDYITPKIKSGADGFGVESFFDYLSIPPAVKNLSVLAFYARAYNLIWNEWYRDENLQDSVPVPTDDGPDDKSLYPLLKRGKRQDYFTSSLPAPQKGPGAMLPLGSTAPVRTEADPSKWLTGVSPAVVYHDAEHGGTISIPVDVRINGNGALCTSAGAIAGTSLALAPSNLIADLSSATAASINSLRQAIALQQFLEQDMRGGTRYVELILSHFGVRSPDYRLQRPEYLGGSVTRINISPIAQTSSSDATSPQGNLAAMGVVGSTGNGFTHSFTEHGVILGLVSVNVDLTYQQGVDRHFLRNTRYDYFFPTLAHLGEQGIYNQEIFAQGTAQDNELFGYNERFAEYRFKNSYITGKFRSLNPASNLTESIYQSLDIWHLAQVFKNLPVLNNEFIQENPPIKRVLAVQDEPELLLDVYHEFDDIRPIPMYGIPGLRRV
ncbi:major capsid protein [Dipodfec virus UOA04_Rod_760]|nr:major capsid protein [Dipodfec virus UOA04_Rod_760]